MANPGSARLKPTLLRSPYALLALWWRSGMAALRGEYGLILGLLLIALLAHSINMFQLPAFTHNGDEGIYTGQALAVLYQGKLAPYTYWYDHAPAGWIFLAAWIALSGGAMTFGSPIESGRILMLLLHLVMVYRLYQIARKLGCGPSHATLGMLLFSLSPLAIFYQRPVMLDNLMLFWILVSLDLLLDGQGRLSRVALSGFCFGVALLSKETAIFLLPAMIFIAIRERREHHGRFAVGGWLLPVVLVLSWYPLYALLKGEFLPVTVTTRFFGNSQPHVSLLDTLIWQMGRDGGGMFNLNNQFWNFMRDDWLFRDPLLIVAGIAAVFLNLIWGIWESVTGFSFRTLVSLQGWRNLLSRFLSPGTHGGSQSLVVALLGLFPLYYMARGGLVFNFYIVFGIPFFCLNIAILAASLTKRLSNIKTYAILVVLLGFAIGYWAATTAPQLYSEHSSWAGRQAIAWIRQNLPPDSTIIADDAFWPDLRSSAPGSPAFPNIHSHWKVGSDPEIAEGVFQNDWRTVDYLIITPGLERNFEGTAYPIARLALQHAHPIQRWEADGTQVEIWQVDPPSVP